MHRQAGANCTDAKLYFRTIFQFFFYPNGTWTHPPTSKLFLDFWNFFNFAKPLNEVNVSFLGKHTNITEVVSTKTLMRKIKIVMNTNTKKTWMNTIKNNTWMNTNKKKTAAKTKKIKTAMKTKKMYMKSDEDEENEENGEDEE